MSDSREFIKYTFSATELSVLRAIAEARQATWDGNARATDKRYDKSADNVALHFQGVRGEYAVASLLNEPICLPVGKHGDDGADVIHKGYRLDVKTGRTRFGVKTLEGIKCDILVFVRHFTPDSLNVEIVGMISKKRFIELARPIEFNDKNTGYCVEVEYLAPFNKIYTLPERQSEAA